MTSCEAEGDILDRIRTSCARCVAHSAWVRVEAGVQCTPAPTGLAAALAGLARMKPHDVAPLMQLPLRFDSVDEELNTWMLLHVINFGSGFRHELHDTTGSGAWDTMLRGVLTMHVTGRAITTDSMTSFTRAHVAEYFSFPLDVEVQLMPSVYESKPGPLSPLADHLVRAITQCGAALRNRGHDSWAAWLRATCAAPDGTRPSAARFVQALVDTFPPFADVVPLPDGGERVYICKKAQLCAAYMHRKFAKELPALFDFDDVARLTVMSDNVVPAVLRALGIIHLSPELAARVDARELLPHGELDTHIRAAGVVGTEALVAAARAGACAPAGERPAWIAEASDEMVDYLKTLTAADVDEYLWLKGKEPDFRRLERHATQDTYYY